MKPAFCLILLTTVCAAPAANETRPPKEETRSEKPKSRWSIAIGTRVREFRGDFTVGAVPPSGFSLLGASNAAPSGNGDVGFFKGGSGSLLYDDGSVGPAYGTQPGDFGPDGSAYGTINSQSQLASTGRFDAQGDEIFDLSFHSSSSSGSSASGYTPGGFRNSSSAVVVSPFVEVRYQIMERSRWSLNLLGGYSWAQGRMQSGTGTLGSAFNLSTLTTTNSTYTYDHYAFNSGAIGAIYPFQNTQSATIYDAAIANAPNGYTQNTTDSQSPRKSGVQSAANVNQRYIALGSAKLDVSFHEIVFAGELAFNVGRKTQITVAAGPTINVIDATLSSNGAWYSNQGIVSRFSTHSSKSNVEIGVMGQLGVRYNLNSRWFTELNGGYRYVSELNLGTGDASAKLDASSWTTGFAIGFRY